MTPRVPELQYQTRLAAEKRKKRCRSGGLRSARSVVIYFGVYPQILTSFIRSWHHIPPWQTQFAALTPTPHAPPPPTQQPCFLPWFPSPASPESAREEVSQTDPLLMCFLREKSAFHKRPVLSSHTDRAKASECGALIPPRPLGGCHGGGVAAGDTLWYVTNICCGARHETRRRTV